MAPHIERAAGVKLALFALLLMFTVVSVVMPLAGRKWLEISTPDGWYVPQPRPHQLSTFALLTHPERTTAMPASPQYTRAGEIRRELLQRAVASVMPVIFVWLRWSSLGRRGRRRFWPLPGWAMTLAVVATSFGTFFLAVRLEIESGFMPGTGFVLPLFVFFLWCLAEQRLAQRSWHGLAEARQEA